MTDPIEEIIRAALTRAGVAFTEDGKPGGDANRRLDFHVTGADVFIEVKQFHSPRIAEQMSRAPNVIAIQGRGAAEWFARAIAKEAGACRCLPHHRGQARSERIKEMKTALEPFARMAEAMPKPLAADAGSTTVDLRWSEPTMSGRRQFHISLPAGYFHAARPPCAQVRPTHDQALQP